MTQDSHSESDIDWANHYWLEWKYRHEDWRGIFLRFMGIIVSLMIIPWVRWTRPVFLDLANSTSARVVYAVFVLVLFASMCWLFASEYDKLRLAEWNLAGCRREVREDQRPGIGEAFRGPTFFKTILFIIFYIAIWLTWLCLLIGIDAESRAL
jgi:hypothetical protein